MDRGTFESLKISEKIESTGETLYDASGKRMDILGIAEIKVHVLGSDKYFFQEFRILNNRSYRNVILGRDLMKKF